MSAMPGYDHWKTTDPADDGSQEAIEAIAERLWDDVNEAADIDAEIAAEIADEDVEWVYTLADAAYAMSRIAAGVPLDRLTPQNREQFAAAFALASRINDKRNEKVNEAALREYNQGDC